MAPPVLRHGSFRLFFFSREEPLMPFEAFPWFRKVTIEQISNVERPTENHLYWPDLDVDLSVESIRNPDAFPLRSRGG